MAQLDDAIFEEVSAAHPNPEPIFSYRVLLLSLTARGLKGEGGNSPAEAGKARDKGF